VAEKKFQRNLVLKSYFFLTSNMRYFGPFRAYFGPFLALLGLFEDKCYTSGHPKKPPRPRRVVEYETTPYWGDFIGILSKKRRFFKNKLLFQQKAAGFWAYFWPFLAILRS